MAKYVRETQEKCLFNGNIIITIIDIKIAKISLLWAKDQIEHYA